MRGAGRSGLAVAVAAVLTGSSPSFAEDKSSYTLFNPTPDRLLRDMTTDRPDVSESPFTIDAGHIQIESNLFGYWRSRPGRGRDRHGRLRRCQDQSAHRPHLLHGAEPRLAALRGRRTRIPARPAPTITNSGMGGIAVRFKYNVWGNDTFEKPGSTALACCRS